MKSLLSLTSHQKITKLFLTSLQWIYDQILNVYNLQTKRQDILNGAELDFKFDNKFTYQHAYIQMKDF